jgi:FkbM family methyltransferase
MPRLPRVLIVAVIAAAAGAAAAVVARRPPVHDAAHDQRALPDGAKYLAAAYGPARYSQFAEEWIIRDFFKDRPGGVFVDVGANHYRDDSTTYYLEERLGWSGLAVEPLAQFAADYKTYRPKTTFLPFFVSDVSDATAKLYVLDKHTVVSSADRKFTERTGANPRELQVPTITMNDLLSKNGIAKFDFLSMDIELSEPKALAGFDLARYHPELVCIEAHPEVRQQILDYFTRGGYVIVGKYLPADEHNLYFMPLGHEAPR